MYNKKKLTFSTFPLKTRRKGQQSLHKAVKELMIGAPLLTNRRRREEQLMYKIKK